MLLKTIDQIVKETLIETKMSEHFYVDYLMLGLTELDKLSQRYAIGAKTIRVTVEDWKRAALPADYVSWTAVTMGRNQGEKVTPLTYDPRLNPIQNENDAGDPIKYPDAVFAGFYNIPSGGRYYLAYNQSFGNTDDLNKKFAIDLASKEIIFSNDVTDADAVYLTYITDTVSTTAANAVAYYFVDSIKTAIKHGRLKNDPRVSMGRKEEAYRDYKNAKRVLKAKIHPFTLAGFVSSTRRGMHGGPKS